MAIQIHGTTVIPHWSPLGELRHDVRHLRFAEGQTKFTTWWPVVTNWRCTDGPPEPSRRRQVPARRM